MSEAIHGSRWKVFLAFAAIYVIWGSTYLAILYAVRDIPPFMMSGFRFLGAGLILYCWNGTRRKERPGMNAIAKNAVLGILMLVGGTVSVTWAEQYLQSSFAAIIVTCVPFWFVVLDRRKWHYNFSNKIIIAGLFAGVLGVVLLVLSNKTDHVFIQDQAKRWIAVLVIIGGDIAFTSGSLFLKYHPAKTSLLFGASIQLLAAGLFCLALSYFCGETNYFSFARITVNGWLGFFYLLIMGSLVAYLSYLWLLKVRSAVQVSTYVYVNPVIALFLGILLAGEKFSALQFLALAIILTGVLFVNNPRLNMTRGNRVNPAHGEK